MERKPQNYYQNTRPEVMEYIPSESRVVLEIGCGEGAFGNQIKIKNNAEVWGVEPVAKHAERAKRVLDKVLVSTAEDAISKLPSKYFDLIVANDVLEHIVDPYSLLDQLRSVLKPKGIVVSSIPNMRNFHVFYALARHKKWEYQESGILDRTHLRFFTTDSIKDMYNDHGYKVLQHQGINEETNLPRWFRAINTCSRGKLDDMKYVQFVTVAEVQ